MELAAPTPPLLNGTGSTLRTAESSQSKQHPQSMWDPPEGDITFSSLSRPMRAQDTSERRESSNGPAEDKQDGEWMLPSFVGKNVKSGTPSREPSQVPSKHNGPNGINNEICSTSVRVNKSFAEDRAHDLEMSDFGFSIPDASTSYIPVVLSSMTLASYNTRIRPLSPEGRYEVVNSFCTTQVQERMETLMVRFIANEGDVKKLEL